MLLIEAEILFYLPDNDNDALHHNLDAQKILRSAFNFGNDQLFSGTIIANINDKVLERGKIYKVLIEMFTIEKSLYIEMAELIRTGNNFTILNVPRIIGEGIICKAVFE